MTSLFRTDSVFEDEGAEMSPAAAQPGEEGDRQVSSTNPAESEASEGDDTEQKPPEIHSGTG